MPNTPADPPVQTDPITNATAGGSKPPAAPFSALGRRLGKPGVVILITAAMAAAATLWLKVLVPYTFIEPVPCPFEAVTGYDCPGCGLQSSVSNLFALRWKYVLMANLLSPLLLPLFYVLVVSWTAGRLFDVVLWRIDPPGWVVGVGVFVVLLYGVLRNIPALGIW